MARKNTAGSGSILYVPGRAKPYRVQLTVDGKRKSGGYFKSHDEAAKTLRALTAAVDAGNYVDPKRMTLGQWMDVWLEEYNTNTKPSTMTSYRATIETHIRPKLGKVKLSDLQPHQVQQFINHLEYAGKSKTKKTVSPKTTKNVHGVLSAVLKQAVMNKLIKDNPATGCKLPKVTKADVKPLEDEELQKFLDAICDDPFRPVFMFAILAGTRISETLGLLWSDIDFETGKITIDHQLGSIRSKGGSRELSSTKTESGNRIIIAPRSLLDILKHVKKEQAEKRLAAGEGWMDTKGLVFTNAVGQSLAHSTIDHHMVRACQRAGIESHRFHDLRHTYAVRAILAGVPINSVSKQLGHKTISITMDFYANMTDAARQDCADKVQQAFDDLLSKKA